MTERPVVAVLGLDLLGASLARALRETGRYGAVVAWDPDFDVARQAQKHDVADRFVRRAADAVPQTAAAFVAVSAGQQRDTLAAIAPHLRPGVVVCSIDEAHEAATALAAELLPASVSFVCAQPVLWEPTGAETVPSAAVFRQGVFAISPPAGAHPDAVAYLADIAAALGMEPYFVDAREHDAFSSGITRLPAVLAAALLRVVTREGSWRELSRLAGADFRHGTALAEVDPARQQEALAAGREHVVRWLDAMVAELAGLRDALKDGQEPRDLFASAAAIRRKWLRERQVPARETEALETTPDVSRRRFWL